MGRGCKSRREEPTGLLAVGIRSLQGTRSVGRRVYAPSSDTRSHSQEEGEKVTKNKVVSDLSILQHSLGHFKEQVPMFL